MYNKNYKFLLLKTPLLILGIVGIVPPKTYTYIYDIIYYIRLIFVLRM